ncbi:MAG: dephospho-CoA kinase [Bacteroidales bacterium]|nr:dephospho-CoA kinase [Bacteroidales bacterium]
MLKVGLTGSIGSGKTLVSKIFEALGINVFYADSSAKALYENNEVRKEIINIFGTSILTENNKIDKKAFAEIIFNDKSALKKINSIIHPLVMGDFVKWLMNHKNDPYILHEAAILFETDLSKEFDFVVAVSAPENLRIERIMKRDSVNRETVIARIRNQWSDEEKTKLADFVILNDENELLIPQVLKINEKLLNR